MKNVSLTDAEMRKVYDFVGKMRDKQEKRGSRDFLNNDTGGLRLGDNIIGKVGEFSATKVVGGDVDWRIWETGSRGADQFEPDITGHLYGNKKFHVKTCHSKHPLSRTSWTIDRKDPIIETPGSEDWFMLMVANDEGQSAFIGFVKADSAKPYWKNCISSHMAHKRAIYYDDIKGLIKEEIK